jgi:hypothetical protein
MTSHTIDLKDCKTTLEFLDHVGDSLGTKFLNFAFLLYYLKKNHFAKITFTSLNSFREKLPNTVKELTKVLESVKLFYQENGEVFEYEFKE